MHAGKLWRFRSRTPLRESEPTVRYGIPQVTPPHPVAGLDHALGQATALLSRARSARDWAEVQRLLGWIDAHLDQRLRLTRPPTTAP
jgi:hypothetical protein